MERPVIISVDGEARRLVEQAGAGVCTSVALIVGRAIAEHGVAEVGVAVLLAGVAEKRLLNAASRGAK